MVLVSSLLIYLVGLFVFLTLCLATVFLLFQLWISNRNSTLEPMLSNP